ncbi:MAG TPA: alpha/beta hydrolase [Chloroflexota bacterium]|jgi:pimeloyl-ACP methyl ester carboxylesterase
MAELIFIHGAGDSAAVWERQVAALGGEHHLLALDLPGHGARMREQAHADHAANAAEVAGAVAAAAMRQPVVVGHSMGGGVALMYALGEAADAAGGKPPALLHGLVLVGSGARLRMHPAFMQAARERAEAAPDAPLAEPLVPPERCLGPNPAPEVVAWLRDHRARATAQAAYADFQANDRFDVMARLGEIRLPTLIIGGADDSMAPAKFQQYLADNIPGARLVLLPGVGHYPMAEQTAAFNDALTTFLAGLA